MKRKRGRMTADWERVFLRRRLMAELRGCEEQSYAMFSASLDRAIEADAEGAFRWIVAQGSLALVRKAAYCGGEQLPSPDERLRMVLSAALKAGSTVLAAYACTLITNDGPQPPLVLCFADVDTEIEEGNVRPDYGTELYAAMELSASLCSTMVIDYYGTREHLEANLRVVEFVTERDMNLAKLVHENAMQYVEGERVDHGDGSELVKVNANIADALRVREWGERHIPAAPVEVDPDPIEGIRYVGLLSHFKSPVCSAAKELPYDKRTVAWLLMEGRKDDAESAVLNGWVPSRESGRCRR